MGETEHSTEEVEPIAVASRTMSVEEAARELGIGRQHAYKLARSGELPGVIKLGTRYVVSRERLARVRADGECAA
jgi:excisionase family DNA binding protein